MISKRGQLTVFIILGLLLLGTVLFIFVLVSSNNSVETAAERVQGTSLSSSSVQNFIQSCIEQTTEEAILFIGKHGGYYQLPVLADVLFYLPYYYYEEQTKQPAKEQVANEISAYITQELPFCFRNFIAFDAAGYDIKVESIATTTTIQNEQVRVQVYAPTRIQFGEAVTTLESFSATIKARLGTLYDLIEQFLIKQSDDPFSVCVSCLSELVSKENVRAEMYFVKRGEFFFSLVDEQVLVKNEPLIYSFMITYTFQENFMELRE